MFGQWMGDEKIVVWVTEVCPMCGRKYEKEDKQ